MYIIFALSIGRRYCYRRHVLIPLHVQLRGHEYAEARVFALDLCKVNQSGREKGSATGAYKFMVGSSLRDMSIWGYQKHE
jgi:hypothetical protein